MILVTGSGGQLGSEFKKIASRFPGCKFIFADRASLPIEDRSAVQKYFSEHPISICINCAAYTAVDKAEMEREQAFLINAIAVGYLAEICAQRKVLFIHFSTDYVFDGSSSHPYQETDPTAPINAYGESKLKGEQLALIANPSSVIIRTSWLYSASGNNFVKSMLQLMREKETISVVDDQVGCPTNAEDLAMAVMALIERFPAAINRSPLIFNFSNEGTTSWCGFAQAIKEYTGSPCKIIPIATAQYPTVAKRPAYSVLDAAKFRTTFALNISGWKKSLYGCLESIRTK